MFVRQLHYLVAVARECHFGRAASACNVTQPTLSAGIRKLEDELGLPLVIRGHRFLGLTQQGERVLLWAQRIVADYEGMRQDLSGPSGRVSGLLRIGVIPAALPEVPVLVNAFCDRYPDVRVQIQSLSSVAIQRALDDREIDAGVTYLDNEPLSRVRYTPLYEERHIFVSKDRRLADRDSLTWAEAAACSLCLLTRDMQNRRIIDQILAEVGIGSQPRIEANSFVGLWSMVCSGNWASILPNSYLKTFGRVEGLKVLRLVDPIRSHSIGLVTSDRDPASPVATALMRHSQRQQPLPSVVRIPA